MPEVNPNAGSKLRFVWSGHSCPLLSTLFEFSRYPGFIGQRPISESRGAQENGRFLVASGFSE